jgi:hypothetical protein
VDIVTAAQLTPVLTSVMEGMAEGAGGKLWESLTRILGRKRRQDPQLASAVQSAGAHSNHKQAATDLALVIEAHERTDESLAQELLAWFAAASKEFPGQNSVISISGTVNGPVVQAHEIHGNITF